MSRRKGVTLTELMIAMVLMVIMTGAAALLLRNFVTTDQRLSDLSTLYGRARAAFELAITELRHAHVVAYGDEGEIQFSSVISGESHLYRYWVQEGWLRRSVDGDDPQRVVPLADFHVSYVGEGGIILTPPIAASDPVPWAVKLDMMLQAREDHVVRFENLAVLRNRR